MGFISLLVFLLGFFIPSSHNPSSDS